MDEDELEPSQGGAAPAIDDVDEPNCFKILLATDNHVGYNEKDPIRGQDSINTFREILELAREHEVDFVLLAGDLFHENKPSRACIHQVIGLLREYTLGDRPVAMELLSDPMAGKAAGFNFPPINYEDPNLNVAIPCFSIHGNHDDPQGTGPEGALCALDVLSVAGVVNYFGKVHLAADEASTTDPHAAGMTIQPVLLQKGETRLAMYGIGNVRDTRMHYELRSNRVRMFLPEDDDGPDWFNLLLVHQNRVKHGPQNSVPEGMFDDRIDLVVWGHEHDCRIVPEPVAKKEYYITQPGSSVATSLAHGEAIPKKVGILRIQGKHFQIEPIPLKTVRPFKMDEVVLSEEAAKVENDIDLEKRETITAFLATRVEALIAEARKDWEELHGDDGEEMMLPLIRLRVETSGTSDPGNAVRFGQQFIGKIANPKDVLQYHKRKLAPKRSDRVMPDQPDFDVDDDGDMLMDANGTGEGISKIKMNELVSSYLKAQTLEVLVENAMEEAVVRYVDKEDTDAIKDFVTATLKAYGEDLKSKGKGNRDYDDADNLKQALEQTKDNYAHKLEENGPLVRQPKAKGRKRDDDVLSDDSMLYDDNSLAGGFRGRSASVASDQSRVSAPGRGKGSRGGKTTSATRGKKAPARGKSRGKAAALFEPASGGSSDEPEPEYVPGRRKIAAPPIKQVAPKKGSVAGGSRQASLSFAPSQSRPVRSGAARGSQMIDISDDSD